MITPSETQRLILIRAATRPGNLALPLPQGIAGAAAKMVVGKMLSRGWLTEIGASPRAREPLWRETGDGHGTTLIVTEAGLEAIGVEPEAASAIVRARRVKVEPEPKPARIAEAAAPAPGRAGTKQAQIIALLQRPEGASIAEIVAATGWQAHTARGMISGALKKRLGLAITSEKAEGRGTVYRIATCAAESRRHGV